MHSSAPSTVSISTPGVKPWAMIYSEATVASSIHHEGSATDTLSLIPFGVQTMNIVEGNLFDYEYTHVLAHGVNCIGVMGAGIAAQFATRYPAMRDYYSAVCTMGSLTGGDVLPWSEAEPDYDDYRVIHILNCASQFSPGANARMDFLAHSLHLASAYCKARGDLPLAIPEIGCGIGGLDPVEAYRLFEEIGRSVDLTVVKYVPRGA